MKNIKIGHRIRFKKFDWVIVSKREHISGFVEYRYRVYRKYFKNLLPLSNTKTDYFIDENKIYWITKRLSENKNFIPQMCLWSGIKGQKE